MIRAIRKIDSALKRFYRLENDLPAELFLVGQSAPAGALSVANAYGSGALVILDESHQSAPGIEVGIYFDGVVKQTLAGFDKWPRAEWSHAQMQAFSVAVEELSHFN